MKPSPRLTVLLAAAVIVIAAAGFWAFSHMRTVRIERDFRAALQQADTAMQQQDRLRAERAIHEAQDSASSILDYIRVMRRGYEYYELWDGPQPLFRTARQAAALEPEEQRFWALAVDAALAAEEYQLAKEWALQYLQQPAFQDLVLEAVLRGGGITESDGSAFGDLLLLLSRLLDDPAPEDFFRAAIATGDPRYAVNALLLSAGVGDYPAVYDVLDALPAAAEASPAAAAILYAQLGMARRALELLHRHPPNPNSMLQSGWIGWRPSCIFELMISIKGCSGTVRFR